VTCRRPLGFPIFYSARFFLDVIMCVLFSYCGGFVVGGLW
jgi:hypothetical protein